MTDSRPSTDRLSNPDPAFPDTSPDSEMADSRGSGETGEGDIAPEALSAAVEGEAGGIDSGSEDGVDPAVRPVHRLVTDLRREIGKVIVGQDEVVEQALVVLLAAGHVLLEGAPGLAKTLLVRALARAIRADFRRVQFTPDLMPSDVVGTTFYELRSGAFQLRRGPVFTNLLLADEINRTPPKTQSALLEAMEERQVSLDGTTHALAEPFMVFATQNPIEHEGTYPLPEAQLDRFMMKIVIGYPTADEEIDILRGHHEGFDARRLEEAGIEPCADSARLAECRRILRGVRVDDPILGYIAAVVRRTRESPRLSLGASPRAGIALLESAKAAAGMSGRAYVIPDDVKRVALPVLRHRIVLRPEAEIEGIAPDRLLNDILSRIEVPR